MKRKPMPRHVACLAHVTYHALRTFSQEFRKLEEEVDAEMEIDDLSPPEWITERISAGELLDVDAGRLARRLTAMIRHSVTADRPVAEDTEAVITEFVDKVSSLSSRGLVSGWRCWP